MSYMTTTTEVAEETAEDIDPIAKGFIKVKQTHGVNVYVSPENGQFYAKFAQTADVKWFQRPSLTEIETLITAAVFPYSGHVPVILRPQNIVPQRELDNLAEGFMSDAKIKAAGHYRSYKFEQERTPIVLTGVVRREYSKHTTTVLFRTESDGSKHMDVGYVHPNADLDQQFYELVRIYMINQTQWREQFQQIIDQYEDISMDEIIAELRAQGARVPRG